MNALVQTILKNKLNINTKVCPASQMLEFTVIFIGSYSNNGRWNEAGGRGHEEPAETQAAETRTSRTLQCRHHPRSLLRQWHTWSMSGLVCIAVFWSLSTTEELSVSGQKPELMESWDTFYCFGPFPSNILSLPLQSTCGSALQRHGGQM